MLIYVAMQVHLVDTLLHSDYLQYPLDYFLTLLIIFHNVMEFNDSIATRRVLSPDVQSISLFVELWNNLLADGLPLLPLWREKYKYSALTATDIDEWRKCIEKEVYGPEEQKKEIAYLLKTYADKYPLPENYCQYFDHVGYSDREKVLKAFEVCELNYVSSHILWDKIRQNTGVDYLLFSRRLRTPHRDINQMYNDHSAWVSESFPKDYIQLMRDASQMVTETKRVMRYVEKLEGQVKETPGDPQVWITYMKKLAKYAASKSYSSRDPIINYNSVRQVFLRSLSYGKERGFTSKWIPVWLAYIRILEGNEEVFLLDFYLQAINEMCRTFSTLSEAYIPLLRSVSNEEEVWSLLKMVMSCVGTTGWSEAVEELLGGSTRAQFDSTKVIALLNPFGQIAATTNLEDGHKLFQVVISYLEKTLNPEAIALAKSLVIEFFENFAMETKAWLSCFNFFTRHLEKHAQKLLTLWDLDALEMDNPTELILEVVLYVRMNSSGYEYIDLLNRVDSVKEKLNSGAVPETAPVKHEEEQANKRVKTETQKIDNVTRNREQFRIRLSPLANGVGDEDVRAFFKGYGDPISIQIVDGTAIVELSSEQEVMTCLTRDVKPLNGEPVKISRLFANTLWITNYPPHYSIQNIEDLISSLGKAAIDIRLPSQVDLKERRFCYADFADPETAQHVRNNLNGLNVENYVVQVEISNPTLRKERKAHPIARQVYAHNLNFKQTTENTLRGFFQKFGDVDNIKMPLNEANRNRKNTNNGFAFVTFTTETAAKEALKLGAAQLDGRRIEISAVKTKQSLQNINASHFKADSSVSIQNLSELVTSEQLKVYLEEKVGPVSKILLQPSKQSALVEFEAFKDAGKVGLLLEGVEYENHILHVGLKQDFINSETKAPTMVPPMLMRRRRK